jgi:cyclopropane fatty-acyl-phospholipid synthase-like methyltransferase
VLNHSDGAAIMKLAYQTNVRKSKGNLLLRRFGGTAPPGVTSPPVGPKSGSPGGGYESLYEAFESSVMRQVRSEAYGQDFGQHSWVTAHELESVISFLRLSSASRLLDIGCGPGGPLTHIAESVRCRCVGTDISEAAIKVARTRAKAAGLDQLLSLQVADSNEPMPFDDASFDAVISIDVVLHLRERSQVFSEVARLLAPGGRFWFTDAGVVAGVVSNEEIALRSTHGFTQFVPPGFNENALEQEGFIVTAVVDRTSNMLDVASGRLAARLNHRVELERVEGSEYFEQQRRYLETTVSLARRRALARFSYEAVLD